MRICGADISGREVTFCVLEYDKGLIEIVPTRNPRLSLRDSVRQNDVRYLQRALAQFLSDYKVSEVIVRERPTKGKFSGSAESFKLEALLQSLPDYTVKLIKNTTLKETLKRYPLSIDFAESGLKKFQKPAFECAYARINKAQTSDEITPDED